MQRIISGVLAGLAILFGVVALIVIIGLIIAYPMMLLWNGCLVPAVDGLHDVGWLQMWGIIILFGILFRSSSSSSSS